MSLWKAYWKSFRAYLRTAKGKHDVLDYGRAILQILTVIVLLMLIAHIIFA